MRRSVRYLLLALVVVYCVGPVVWQLATSLKPDVEIARIPPLLPARPTLSNYLSVFRDHPFLRIIGNSVLVASSSTLLSLVFGSLCAFALARLRVRHTLPILVFVLSASMFPAIATVSPLYIIIRALGLRDTLFALIMIYTTFSLPLSIWVLMNFFKGVPREIYLAAKVDGCTPFQAFRRIILPLSIPGVAATAMLVFIFCWNEFLFALTFTATRASRTIPVAIALFQTNQEIPWGQIAAATIVVMVPAFILVFFFQKSIIAGLTAGSVKG